MFIIVVLKLICRGKFVGIIQIVQICRLRLIPADKDASIARKVGLLCLGQTGWPNGTFVQAISKTAVVNKVDTDVITINGASILVFLIQWKVVGVIPDLFDTEDGHIGVANSIWQELQCSGVASNLEVLAGGQLQGAILPTEIIGDARKDTLGLSAAADLHHPAYGILTKIVAVGS